MARERFLVVYAGPRQREVMFLRGRTFLIGRAPECDLRLVDAYASRHHCLLEQAGDEWRVRDLGSRNGTWVGERRVTKPTPLAPGTVLRVGRTYVLYADPTTVGADELDVPPVPGAQ
ncbi:MAG: FHA domain-containing protein [Ardenticatenia bacterium]|nr:FHA domain-containing protein [Ardenticatenia bacterium]